MTEPFGDIVWKPGWPALSACPGTGDAHPMEFDADRERWGCAACAVSFLWDETVAVMAYGARGKILAQTHRN